MSYLPNCLSIGSPGPKVTPKLKNLNENSSFTYLVTSSSRFAPTTRRLIAFSTPNQAEITVPRDTRVDSDDESFMCPSDPEE